MTKQTFQDTSQDTAVSSMTVMGKVILTAKVGALVIVTLLSLVGGYVVTNAELRNQTIDYAQNQHPKE